MLLIKSIAFIAFGAAIGAAIGYSQILCPSGGQCAITGSWYGGAMFGGLMGMAVSGAIGGGVPKAMDRDDATASDTASNDESSSNDDAKKSE